MMLGRWLIAGLVLLQAAAATSCGPSSEGSDVGAANPVCAGTYGLPVEIETSVSAEARYLDDVVVCAADLQYGPFKLRNTGDAVWTLAVADRRDLRFESRSANGTFFSGLFADPLLLPDDVVVVDEPPRDFTWNLSTEFVAGWEALGEVFDQAKDLGGSALVGALDRKSPKGAAAATCAIAAVDAVRSALSTPDAFSDSLEIALGAGAGGVGCASSWREAWRQDFEPSVSFLDDLAERLRIVNRVTRILVSAHG